MVSLGQRPRTNGSTKSDSAESAIHFRRRSVQSLPMPQSLSKVIVHVIFSTKDRALARFRGPASNACLSSDSLPQPRCRIRARRGCCRSRSHCHDVAATCFASSTHRRDKESLFEMDQSARRSLPRFFLATGLWRLFGEPESAGYLVLYVKAQPEHHRARTFQEEYSELLRRHGVDFDERYVWD